MHPLTNESVHEEMKSLQDITNLCVENEFEQESQNSKNSSTLQVQIEPEILAS